MTQGQSRPATTDVCDAHPERVRIAEPVFHNFGGRARFAGRIVTLRVHEDNALVRAALSDPGQGRVLVVDGGGSLRTALLGGNLAALARASGWDGVLVFGCVRDSSEIAATDLGVKALAAIPRKSGKTGAGGRDVTVRFAGVEWKPGDWLCADEDGVILAEDPLA